MKKSVLAISLLLSACASAAESPAPAFSLPAFEAMTLPSVALKGDDYVYVWLKTGPATIEDDAERGAAFDGHFANMARLFEERSLLIAGPLGDPKADPLHRGILIFDVDEVEEARELTRTDPAVRAGLFIQEAEPFYTSVPLRSIYVLEETNEAGLDGMRSYVIARSPHADRADAAVAPLVAEGLISLTGRIGSGATECGLYVILTEDVEEAREMLRFTSGDEDLGWLLSPWYGSKMVAQLRATNQESE